MCHNDGRGGRYNEDLDDAEAKEKPVSGNPARSGAEGGLFVFFDRWFGGGLCLAEKPDIPIRAANQPMRNPPVAIEKR